VDKKANRTREERSVCPWSEWPFEEHTSGICRIYILMKNIGQRDVGYNLCRQCELKSEGDLGVFHEENLRKNLS